MEEVFNWNRVLFNKLPANYLLEVVFRSTIMFLVVLVALRISGKRSIKQLSIFELVIIIALGSAAGDPMLYEDVGIIPAFTVFVTVILLYKCIIWLTNKSEAFETFMEGKPIYLIREGRFSLNDFNKEQLSQEEFLSELRLKNIEHLGQIKTGIVETSGDLSIIYYSDEEVRPGLPIYPDILKNKVHEIKESAIYACTFCGNPQFINRGVMKCEICDRENWVKSIQTKRIS